MKIWKGHCFSWSNPMFQRWKWWFVIFGVKSHGNPMKFWWIFRFLGFKAMKIPWKSHHKLGPLSQWGARPPGRTNRPRPGWSLKGLGAVEDATDHLRSALRGLCGCLAQGISRGKNGWNGGVLKWGYPKNAVFFCGKSIKFYKWMIWDICYKWTFHSWMVFLQKIYL